MKHPCLHFPLSEHLQPSRQCGAGPGLPLCCSILLPSVSSTGKTHTGHGPPGVCVCENLSTGDPKAIEAQQGFPLRLWDSLVCPKEFSLAGEFGLPEITTHPPGTAHPSQRLPLFRSHISFLICCEYFLIFCVVFCSWVKAEEVPGVLSTPPIPEHCRVHPRACCSPRRLPQAWLFAGAGWNQSVSNGFKTQCWGCEAFFYLNVLFQFR